MKGCVGLAPPCLLLFFGNSVNRKYKCYHIRPLYLPYFEYFDSETISGACGLRFEGDDSEKGRQLF